MRIVAFGDSWTAGQGIEDDDFYQGQAYPPWGSNFVQEFRKMNSWPRWLAEKFNCLYVNLGVCAYGNEKILNLLTEVNTTHHIDLYNGDIKYLNVLDVNKDIIIIMLTYPYRDSILPIDAFNLYESILKPYKHFYFNAFYPMFKDEDFDTSTLPPYYINPNRTTSEVLREYEIKNDVSVWEYNLRSPWNIVNDKRKYYEGNFHPNLLGYKIIAEYIYNNIKDKL